MCLEERIEMSQTLIKLLLVAYLIIFISCLCERKWTLAKYWFGAMIQYYWDLSNKNLKKGGDKNDHIGVS